MGGSAGAACSRWRSARLAAQDGCRVIAGATTAEQVKANAAAAEWIPTAEDLADLDRVVPSPSRR